MSRLFLVFAIVALALIGSSSIPLFPAVTTGVGVSYDQATYLFECCVASTIEKHAESVVGARCTEKLCTDHSAAVSALAASFTTLLKNDAIPNGWRKNVMELERKAAAQSRSSSTSHPVASSSPLKARLPIDTKFRPGSQGTLEPMPRASAAAAAFVESESEVESHAEDSNPMVRVARRWSDARLNYHFDAFIENPAGLDLINPVGPMLIAGMNTALADYRAKTCLRFTHSAAGFGPGGAHPSVLINYAGIIEGQSEMAGGIASVLTTQRRVSIGDVAIPFVGTVIHELGHLVGMKHTMARADAGNFIIKNGCDAQYALAPAADFADMQAYEYESIMHYEMGGCMSFNPANFSPWTVVRGIQQAAVLARMAVANRLSATDAAIINGAYGCFQVTFTFGDASTKSVHVSAATTVAQLKVELAELKGVAAGTYNAYHVVYAHAGANHQLADHNIVHGLPTVQFRIIP